MEHTVDFEVLMACMHQENFDIAYQSGVDSDLLIINQCDREDYQEITVNGYCWRMISTTERGISKSRNMALKNARGKIALWADDDECLTEGYRELVLNAFASLPDASMIAFNVERLHLPTKSKYYEIKKIKRSNGARGYGTPMTAFKTEDILRSSIRFDERIGSGSEWGGGEESLFQREMLKHSLKIYEYPATVCTINYSSGSQWFHGYDEKFFYNSGVFSAIIERKFLIRWLRLLYISFIRFRNDKELSPFQKIQWFCLGEKGWKKNVTYQQFVENGCQFESKQK
ncbi:MAG: glycosyltransferase family 2 protein [Clostridia bacterium]|nr:glycosyltransferase family 2 protein [Clostridia bacterium]